MKQQIEIIQQNLRKRDLLGWLVYDVQFRNSAILTWLGLPPHAHVTRKFFYWVPARGTPVKIVHAIERDKYTHLYGNEAIYSSREELALQLKALFPTSSCTAIPGYTTGCIAMEIWPSGEVPSLSTVDYGTVEWIRSFQVEVTSSWEVLQDVLSRLSQEQLINQQESYTKLATAIQTTLSSIKATSSDISLQEILMLEMSKKGLYFDHPPCIAFGPDSALPHFSPQSAKKIAKNQLLLIDAWGKQQNKEAPYVDLTQVYFTGPTIPQEIQECYAVVYEAQAAAITYLKQALQANMPIRGCDVDKSARDVIAHRGWSKFFTHRLGHNITQTLHGPGANFDSFETNDTREIMPGTSYSIEPGIYFPEKWGIRLECTVQITYNRELIVLGVAPKSIPQLLVE